jgi:tetratricopeptide (TPR) repeat protein
MEIPMMSTAPLPCPEDALLEAYRRGQLPPEKHADVAAHVDGCSACQAKLDHETSAFVAVGAAAVALPPPPAVPGYEILEVLGRGGMGVVYLARQVGLNRLVALKMILAGPYATTEQLARFQTEAEAAGRLRHPNIVQIYEIGQAEGRPFFSLEYVEGGSLAQRLKETVLPPREAARLLESLARAVQHAHQQGVVHRDIKPANILLARDGTPKVADFSLARQLDTDSGLTRTGAVFGTPSYMAPEQAEGRSRDIGPATDIYALGAVLYECLTGRPPFRAATSSQTLDQVRHEEPVAPRRLQPALPRDLETICLTCLRKEPPRRYPRAEALADDLRRFLAGEPVHARPTSALERGVKWVKRRPGLAALLGLLLAAAAILIPREVLLRLEAEEQSRVENKLRREAEDARGRARHEAHISVVMAADKNARQWLWKDARGLYTVAIENDFPDRRELEVKRLACLMADPERRELRSELARLEAEKDLPAAARAAVLLYRGEVGLIDGEEKDRQKAEGLIHEALKEPCGLSAADKSYARGLLADSPHAAIEHYREALDHAPFHRANSALVLELVFSGKFEEARRGADFMLRVNPGDTVAHYALAVIAALEEDPQGVKRHMRPLHQAVGERGRAAMDRQLAFFQELPQLNRWLHGRGPRKGAAGGNPFALGTLINQVAKQVKALDAEGAPGILGVPAPVLLRPRKLMSKLWAIQSAQLRGDPNEAARLAAEAEGDYPEAVLRLQHANAVLALASRHMKRGDWEAAWRAGQRVRVLARQAAAAPTLMPFGPYRHNARWLCVLVDGWEAVNRRVGLTAGVTASLRAGPLSAATSLGAHGTHFETERARRSREEILAVAAHSRGYDEARTALLPQFVEWLEPEDARLLLTDWIDDEADEMTPLRLRARLELRLGNFGSALRDARRVLARHADDRDMRAVERAAQTAVEGARR